MIFKKLYALWHDECYHGWGRSKRFFEGWYYKLVSEDQGQAIAIIPGIAMDETGSKQAFIQVLDGKKTRHGIIVLMRMIFVPHQKNTLYLLVIIFSLQVK